MQNYTATIDFFNLAKKKIHCKFAFPTVTCFLLATTFGVLPNAHPRIGFDDKSHVERNIPEKGVSDCGQKSNPSRCQSGILITLWNQVQNYSRKRNRSTTFVWNWNFVTIALDFYGLTETWRSTNSSIAEQQSLRKIRILRKSKLKFSR